MRRGIVAWFYEVKSTSAELLDICNDRATFRIARRVVTLVEVVSFESSIIKESNRVANVATREFHCTGSNPTVTL